MSRFFDFARTIFLTEDSRRMAASAGSVPASTEDDSEAEGARRRLEAEMVVLRAIREEGVFWPD